MRLNGFLLIVACDSVEELCFLTGVVKLVCFNAAVDSQLYHGMATKDIVLARATGCSWLGRVRSN